VATLAEVPRGGLLSVRTPGGEQVVLTNVDGDIGAVLDRCSHQDYALSAGELLDDGTIECIWHGARFDRRTGAVLGPPAVEDVPAFAVRVEGDAILLGPRLTSP